MPLTQEPVVVVAPVNFEVCMGVPFAGFRQKCHQCFDSVAIRSRKGIQLVKNNSIYRLTNTTVPV